MTRTTATLLVGVALAACLLLPGPLSAQPNECPTLEASQALEENQEVLAAERDGVGTLDFTAKYAGSSVSIEGMLCDAEGKPLADTEVRLITYSVSPDTKPSASKDGRPSAADLRYANGEPFSVLGTRTTVTSSDGGFRFIGVAPGKVAFAVDWKELPSLPSVTWNVMWESGPVMVVGREF